MYTIDHIIYLTFWMTDLTFTTLWANLTDGKLMTFFLFFPRKQDLTCHANCLPGDNLHEMSNPVSWEN